MKLHFSAPPLRVAGVWCLGCRIALPWEIQRSACFVSGVSGRLSPCKVAQLQNRARCSSGSLRSTELLCPWLLSGSSGKAKQIRALMPVRFSLWLFLHSIIPLPYSRVALTASGIWNQSCRTITACSLPSCSRLKIFYF